MDITAEKFKSDGSQKVASTALLPRFAKGAIHPL